MEKIGIDERVFMTARVSNWINRPVYDARLKEGRWQVRLNGVDKVYLDLSEVLKR